MLPSVKSPRKGGFSALLRGIPARKDILNWPDRQVSYQLSSWIHLHVVGRTNGIPILIPVYFYSSACQSSQIFLPGMRLLFRVSGIQYVHGASF
jgi:hypothetical protein